MARVPVIASYVLRGVPEFIRCQIGEKALQRANRVAGFDAEIIEEKNCFVSQTSVVKFVEAAARAAGDTNLGLLFVPGMNVATYGAFGRYILGADTLGQAVERAIMALHYHSTYDTLSATTQANEVRFTYKFALAGASGYNVVACAAAGELVSVVKAYLSQYWRPLRVELDIEKPSQSSLYEDVFQCPVVFNAPAVSIVLARQSMLVACGQTARPLITLQDVARDQLGGAPQSLLDVIQEQIRVHLHIGDVSIDKVAQSVDISVRTLQRELQFAGTEFRSLTGMVRIKRATELLRERGLSLTVISEDLGYASPTGFSRAFRNVTGLSPREYRMRARS
ncbi:AraC family transcriptional regulator ligand-binding domain-containing protein [Brucella cytisi]|uniref:AraC family transcriptional regulator n=1 Tax=Brucella cytisi TaxID=407152 RepID=UPI0035E39E44